MKALLALVAFALVVPCGAALAEPPGVDPEALIRLVVRNQRLAEESLSSFTFDQLEVETKYGKKGVPKETTSRLFYVFSGDSPGAGSRELVEVDGRAATVEEKRKAAESDAKAQSRRLERRAAERAKRPPTVSGDDDDPLVGRRRLSDLIARYEIAVVREEVRDGRLHYVIRFSPRSGLRSKGLAENALSSLAGEAVIDATDFQIRAIDALLVSPVKVAGGLAARVDDARVRYEAAPIGGGRWFPCAVDLRMRGKKAVVARLDVGYGFRFSNFRTFRVETESAAEEVAADVAEEVVDEPGPRAEPPSFPDGR